MRVVTKTPDGWQVLIYAIPFDGETLFQDAKHVENFVRYLFSQSRAHQPIESTARNTVVEREAGVWKGVVFNTRPSVLLADFLRRRFPGEKAAELWENDGFYVLFALRSPGGVAVSNMLSTDGASPLEVAHPLLEEACALPGISPGRVERDVMDFWGGKGPVWHVEGDGVPELRWEEAYAVLHTTLSRRSANVVLSVSHVDQPRTNPFFHIHRLLLR